MPSKEGQDNIQAQLKSLQMAKDLVYSNLKKNKKVKDKIPWVWVSRIITWLLSVFHSKQGGE